MGTLVFTAGAISSTLNFDNAKAQSVINNVIDAYDLDPDGDATNAEKADLFMAKVKSWALEVDYSQRKLVDEAAAGEATADADWDE